MPFKRFLEPADGADPNETTEGHVAKAGRIQPATEGRTKDEPTADGEAEGHVYRRG